MKVSEKTQLVYESLGVLNHLPWIGQVKVFHEDRVDELLDDHGVILPATAQDLGVGELVEAGCLADAAPLPLLVVQTSFCLT